MLDEHHDDDSDDDNVSDALSGLNVSVTYLLRYGLSHLPSVLDN